MWVHCLRLLFSCVFVYLCVFDVVVVLVCFNICFIVLWREVFCGFAVCVCLFVCFFNSCRVFVFCVYVFACCYCFCIFPQLGFA